MHWQSIKKNPRHAALQLRNTSTSKSVFTTPPAGDDNMVMLIQVPLKFRGTYYRSSAKGLVFEESFDKESEDSVSNIEEAVVGHGEIEGPFIEMGNQAIERDDRYLIRVTVQFYKATDNGVVSEEDIKSIREQIDRVYADGSYVGSLVVPETEGLNRPTDWKPSRFSF